jgi:hypothetical protein
MILRRILILALISVTISVGSNVAVHAALMVHPDGARVPVRSDQFTASSIVWALIDGLWEMNFRSDE